MDSMDIPLWIKILGLFLAITLVFVLGEWEIIWNCVCDAAKGVRGKPSRWKYSLDRTAMVRIIIQERS
jgi:hypothetical protein